MTYGMRRVKPKSIRRRNKMKLYGAVFGITIFLLFYLSAHVLIISLGDSVQENRRRYTLLTDEINNLEIEVAGLRMGSRIIAIARDDLGLEMPVGAPEKLF
ncbi:hypothetical protein ACFL47_06115 [Candidatus Latescibacterota bacterium]